MPSAATIPDPPRVFVFSLLSRIVVRRVGVPLMAARFLSAGARRIIFHPRTIDRSDAREWGCLSLSLAAVSLREGRYEAELATTRAALDDAVAQVALVSCISLQGG